MVRIQLFFVNDTATTEIYTLSLHDALPICLTASATVRRLRLQWFSSLHELQMPMTGRRKSSSPNPMPLADRKSTRLNSSHANISYAVFCLKKKIRAPHVPGRNRQHRFRM